MENKGDQKTQCYQQQDYIYIYIWKTPADVEPVADNQDVDI